MSENTNLVPKRRFKGFQNDGAWEQRKLKELSSLITKGTSPLDKSGNGSINFIKIENIDSSSGKITPTKRITAEEHDGYLRRSQLQENDILFSIAGTLGRVATVNKGILPANTNQALAIIRLKIGYLHYITTYLKGKAVSEYVKRNPTIGAQPNLSLEQVGNLEISLPNSKEQTQIGTFFKYLDNLITLHQRKLKKTKFLKSAYLSEMFPQEGECVPKRRFTGFNDAWEQRKLGAMSSSFEYGLNAAAKEFDGENKYIRITDIDDETRMFLETGLTSPDTDLTIAGNYKLQENDIVFARTGASVGKSYIYRESDGLVYYAGFLIRARIKPEYSSEFVFQNTLTKKYSKYITVTSQRSGQPGVNAQEFAEYKISVPTFAEQQQIGSFLRNLDNLIARQQRKLDKLQNIKKAFLNEMFI